MDTNNCHIETLKNYQKYTSITHKLPINLINIRQVCVMLKSCESEIIYLSKTWLTNNQHQLGYVNIAGYKLISNTVKIRNVGGVGFYIKDNIHFKTRNDLTKNIVNMELTFTELSGRNKNTPYLVAVAYQPISYESNKLLWLENFKTLLSEATTK